MKQEIREVIITDKESVLKYRVKHFNAVNDRLLQLFPRETVHVTTHVLRKLYAHMAWLEHGSKFNGSGGELW